MFIILHSAYCQFKNLRKVSRYIAHFSMLYNSFCIMLDISFKWSTIRHWRNTVHCETLCPPVVLFLEILNLGMFYAPPIFYRFANIWAFSMCIYIVLYYDAKLANHWATEDLYFIFPNQGEPIWVVDLSKLGSCLYQVTHFPYGHFL